MHPGGAEAAPPGDGVPFAPTAPRPTAAVSMAQRAFDWSQRFRFPVGIAFNVLIVGAAFVAYTVSQNAGAENDGVRSSGLGALVADADPGAQGPSGDDGGAEPGDRGDGARRASGSFEADPTTSSVPATTRRGASSPTTRPPTPTEVQALDRRVAPVSIGRDADEAPDVETTTSAVATSSTVRTSPTTVASTTSSTQPTTTVTATPTEPPQAFIGDRVRTDDGRGLSGVGVTLRQDGDSGNRQEVSDTTDGGGNYGFTVEPGCYVVNFAVPDGASVVAGNQQQRVCVDGGQRLDSVDLTVRFAPQVAAPPACDVQTGNNPYAGVEIRDSNRAWAPGYVFYGQSGNVIVRTRNLGPPDDTTNPDRNQIEWTSSRYGFEESDVYSVAAEDENGNVSGRVTCSRRSV